MAKAKSKKKKSKKVKSVKAKKPSKRMDRIEAAVICLGQIKGQMAYHTAVRKADEIYVKAGSGKSNPKEAGYSFRRASRVLTLLKMIQIKDGQISRLTAPFTVSRD